MEQLPTDFSGMDLSSFDISPEQMGFASWIIFGFFALITWSFIWKGWALWRSARLNQKGWFVALLLLNTLGILEILYIFVISKKKD
ncbi:MAG: DUF5652 family protein [Candidatus Gracilibacteria bacterium]